MKQQITPWSIYDNFTSIKHKQTDKQDKTIQKYTKPSKIIPSKYQQAKHNSKILAQIQIQKTKLDRKINQLFVIRNLRELLTKQSFNDKNLPVLSRKSSNQKIKKFDSQSYNLTSDDNKRIMNNMPHFPKIHKSKKIMEEHLPQFDDRSIHEKIELIKDKNKKRFSLMQLNSPSSTLV